MLSHAFFVSVSSKLHLCCQITLSGGAKSVKCFQKIPFVLENKGISVPILAPPILICILYIRVDLAEITLFEHAGRWVNIRLSTQRIK